MDKTTSQLLYFLSVAMETNANEIEETGEVDWNKLFCLAGIHNVIPMIYQTISIKQLNAHINPGLVTEWRKLAVSYSVDQIRRTAEFLEIYDKFNKAGIRVLLVKGVMLRRIYPNHDYRSSGDEDIYIHRNDFSMVDSILTASGLMKEKSVIKYEGIRQETIYTSIKSRLIIEVHVDLFDPERELFKMMNDLFGELFEHSISENIEGITIYTLAYSYHFLFLVLHFVKHFLAFGVGIRQVCDLVMFCNTYGEEIDYPWVWQQVKQLGYDILLLNLLDIGRRYLGLEKEKIDYPSWFTMEDIHGEALLEDIIKAGSFGINDSDQMKACIMTLQAVMADRNSRLEKYNKHLLLKTLFPERESIISKYAYCRKKPILIPLAWIHRIITYAIQSKNPVQMLRKARRSLVIGRKRINVLKEYKIIGTD